MPQIVEALATSVGRSLRLLCYVSYGRSPGAPRDRRNLSQTPGAFWPAGLRLSLFPRFDKNDCQNGRSYQRLSGGANRTSSGRIRRVVGRVPRWATVPPRPPRKAAPATGSPPPKVGRHASAPGRRASHVADRAVRLACRSGLPLATSAARRRTTGPGPDPATGGCRPKLSGHRPWPGCCRDPLPHGPWLVSPVCRRNSSSNRLGAW